MMLILDLPVRLKGFWKRRRSAVSITSAPRNMQIEAFLLGTKLNRRLAYIRGEFKNGAKPCKAVPEPHSKLLTAGTLAPDFSVVDKNGKASKLSDYRGKIVVLDFWATWCPPCMASLPHTNEVAKKMADKGVVTLAVNVWDKKDAFDAWLPKNETKYDSITFVLDPSEGGQAIATPLYHVSGIPTQYTIDRDGKIRKSFVGFDGPTDDLENTIAAADKPMTGTALVAPKAGR